MDARYQNVRRVPKDRLREIGAGRIAKFSDINPQWRVEIMTETYGMYGIGWKYEVGEAIHQPMPDGSILLYLPVSVYIRDSETKEWSAPATQYGGDWLIKKEKGGLVGQDEAYKKCLTDALGKALAIFGVAGDIYAGCWDGSKYIDKSLLGDTPNDPPNNDTPPEAQKPESLKKAEELLGGTSTFIEDLVPDEGSVPEDIVIPFDDGAAPAPMQFVRTAGGKTQILFKGEWRWLERAKANTLNEIINDKNYAPCHDEARKLLMQKAK